MANVHTFDIQLMRKQSITSLITNITGAWLRLWLTSVLFRLFSFILEEIQVDGLVCEWCNVCLWWCLSPVQSCAGGHAASKATDARLPEVRNAGQVGSHHCQWVWWVYEETILTKDHTAILNTYRETTQLFFSYMFFYNYYFFNYFNSYMLEVQKHQLRSFKKITNSPDEWKKIAYLYNKTKNLRKDILTKRHLMHKVS